jgi:ATP-dependent DNA helicase 2 subunit 2
LVRPPSMKKYYRRNKDDDERDYYGAVTRSTEYIEQSSWENVLEAEGENKRPLWDVYQEAKTEGKIKPFTKDLLTRSYRYGATYVDAEGDFERVTSTQGIDICAFFPASNVRLFSSCC